MISCQQLFFYSSSAESHSTAVLLCAKTFKGIYIKGIYTSKLCIVSRRPHERRRREYVESIPGNKEEKVLLQYLQRDG